jgi:hypothetical protein
MEPFVTRAQEYGCKFGLYNHGGWGGEPENLVSVCRELHARGFDNVGVVYNFHHIHHRIEQFAEDLEMIKPYLLCLNLNGMADAADVNKETLANKILPIGSGKHETEMIKHVLASGYKGPIGILGHLENQDVAISLKDNLNGLQEILLR